MEYTVRQLARLAGVSGRTLRYYDQIGLLCPQRASASGYRIYGRDQVDRLQQILLYREMDMELERIKELLDEPGFDPKLALRRHLVALERRRERLDTLISSVKRGIQSYEEGTEMSDQAKFEGFKKKLIEDNEGQYGEEVRAKYGDEAVDESNRKMMNLTKQQYDDMQALSARILEALEQAVQGGESPEGEVGERVTGLHREWLAYTWPQYTSEAHRGLAQMYVDDERFTSFYDKNVPGCAQFLRDAVHRHAK